MDGLDYIINQSYNNAMKLEQEPAWASNLRERRALAHAVIEQAKYLFNPMAFDEETEEDVNNYVAWARSTGRTSDQIAECEEDERTLRCKLRNWSQEFSGKVPAHWGEVKYGKPWHAILRDIKNPHIELNATEIEAAIKYPIWHIPRELGTTRSLTRSQAQLLDSVQH